MNVRSVVEKSAQLLGQEVSISAYLVSGEKTVLVDDPNLAGSAATALALPHPHIQNALQEVVPVRLGGRHLYEEQCVVVGVLARVYDSITGGLELQPKSLVVRRNGEEQYELQFGG